MHRNRIFLLFLALCLLLCGCQRAEAAVDAPEAEQGDFIGALTFLGDSITAHMADRADVEPDQLWCAKERYLNLDAKITYAKLVAPDTGNEETVAELAARLRPRYLVITLGIDYGVYYFRNDQATFAKCYEKLLDAVSAASPDTVILVQSIFPVSPLCRSITNEMIDKANATLREICARRGLLYLDTQRVLRDEQGFLRAEYCSSADGIHLSAEGYRAVLDHIAAQSEKAGWRG